MIVSTFAAVVCTLLTGALVAIRLGRADLEPIPQKVRNRFDR